MPSKTVGESRDGESGSRCTVEASSMSDFEDSGVANEMVRVDGRVVGVAVTLGRRFQFFTTDPSLLALDGGIFESLEEIRRDAAVRLREGPREVA